VAYSNSKRDKAACGIETVSQKKSASSFPIGSELKLERSQAKEERRNRRVRDKDNDSTSSPRQKGARIHKVGEKKDQPVGDGLNESKDGSKPLDSRGDVCCDNGSSIHGKQAEKDNGRNREQARRIRQIGCVECGDPCRRLDRQRQRDAVQQDQRQVG